MISRELVRRFALLVSAVATAALVVAPAPAQAVELGSTSTSGVVLYDQCQQHRIDYTLQPPAGTTFWRLRVVVADPKGLNSQGNVFTSSTSPTSGSFTFQFCGSETPGTWTVRSEGFTQVLPAVQLPFALPDTTFVVRAAATRTELVEKQLSEGRYALTAKVRREDPTGFARAEGVRVRLERLVDGGWQPIRGTRLDTVKGRATTRLSTARDIKVRAVVPGRSNYAGSLSEPVALDG